MTQTISAEQNMQNDCFSPGTAGFQMPGQRDDSPTRRGSEGIPRLRRHISSPINLDDDGNETSQDYDSVVNSTTLQHEKADARHRTNAHSPPPTLQQVQNEALYNYAYSLLLSEHERKHKKLVHDQELEIDNLMFLLSHDSKEMCEVAVGAREHGDGGQEDVIDQVESGDEERGGGCDEMVCPIGVAVLTSFVSIVVALIAFWIWWSQAYLAGDMRRE